jgi:hypothetical protein
MKKLLLITTLVATAITGASAQTVYKTIDSSEMTGGFVNVSELPSNGGAYVFGSAWAIADLCTTFPTSSSVVFSPNKINDPASFWYTPTGEPGSTGNKVIEASLYAESTGAFNGQTVQFDGTVTAFDLSSTYQGVGYTFRAFVMDFAPDYSSVVRQYSSISETGNFQVSLATISDPARHVQWGLVMEGPDVWPTDNAAQIASAGSVTVEAIPEPSTYALLGMTAAGLFAYRARRRK